MKNKKPGRPRDGREAKKHKSVRLEPEYIKLIEKDFPSFSKGVEILIKNYKANKHDLKLCE